MVSLTAGPGHPLAVGVITYTTIPGVVAGSVSVIEGITAVVPLAIKPVMPLGDEPVHVNVVPTTPEVKAIPGVEEPLQIV